LKEKENKKIPLHWAEAQICRKFPADLRLVGLEKSIRIMTIFSFDLK
jgi:hypothetical protein